jgi:hypothetical protein
VEVEGGALEAVHADEIGNESSRLSSASLPHGSGASSELLRLRACAPARRSADGDPCK